eukprot:3275638-Prymnesium_polylepis.1
MRSSGGCASGSRVVATCCTWCGTRRAAGTASRTARAERIASIIITTGHRVLATIHRRGNNARRHSRASQRVPRARWRATSQQIFGARGLGHA